MPVDHGQNNKHLILDESDPVRAFAGWREDLAGKGSKQRWDTSIIELSARPGGHINGVLRRSNP